MRYIVKLAMMVMCSLAPLGIASAQTPRYDSTAKKIQSWNDSLRKETSRRQGMRKTYIRMVADSSDSAIVRWVPDTVYKTLPVVHDTLPPDTVIVVVTTVDSVRLKLISALSRDSVLKYATGTKVRSFATSIDSISTWMLSHASPVPPPPVDTTPVPQPPPPPPPPIPGSNGLTVPAELPRSYVNFPYIAPTGTTITVNSGGNLQAAINTAQRGDEIVLQAGATFTGNFTLPVKSGSVSSNGWIIIRTDRMASLPSEGTRVTPLNASAMPKIVTPNTAPALATVLGASGYRLVGLEISVVSTYTGPQYGILLLGDGSSAQNTLAKVASDLVVDRSYVHGQTNTDTRRCIALHSARTQITDSYLSECHAHGFDAQAINGYNGPGPYKIVNNTLIGSTENIMFGGADPAVPNMIASDIEIRRNYIYTPVTYKGVWAKKNLFELKAAQRVLIEGNVLDGSWQDGQTGFAFTLKAENQSGVCTWCTTSDITIRYNYIRNVGAGFAISGREGSNPNPVSTLAARFTIYQNIVDQVRIGPFAGDGRFYQVLGNASDVDISNNTSTTTGIMSTFVWLDQSKSVTRFAFNKNISTAGQYGLLASSGSEGVASLNQAVIGGYQFVANYLLSSPRSGYPTGTTFGSSLSGAPVGIGADQSAVNAATGGVVVP